MTISNRKSRRENQPTPELRGELPPEPIGEGLSGPPGVRLGGPLSLFLSASAAAGASGAPRPRPRCCRELRSQSCVNILKGTCFLAHRAPARKRALTPPACRQPPNTLSGKGYGELYQNAISYAVQSTTHGESRGLAANPRDERELPPEAG